MIKIAKNSIIQSHKDVLGGEPVFRGTRVPVRTLLDYIESGERLDDFLQDFPTVTKKQTLAVLEFIKQRLAKGGSQKLPSRN